jgi:hypothetical protein
VKILVDMNLSPEWLAVLEQAGWQASHWSNVGSPTAPDTDLLVWARQHGWVLLTQDLDFAELLFHTQANTAPGCAVYRLKPGAAPESPAKQTAMPDSFPYDVFLSHSGKDKAVVRPLTERLR